MYLLYLFTCQFVKEMLLLSALFVRNEQLITVLFAMAPTFLLLLLLHCFVITHL